MENDPDSAGKLRLLRERMAAVGVAAYIVLHDDEWKNEYTPARADRLAWLTGFGGSAGVAVVTADAALAASDARYENALARAVDPACYETHVTHRRGGEVRESACWLAAHLPAGAQIGYDPFIFAASDVKAWEDALDGAAVLVPVEGNLIDAIWAGQPAFPDAPAELYPESFAGQSSADKRRILAQDVSAAGAQALFIASPREIAWLLNVRGTDIPHVPVVLSFALLHADGTAEWFVPDNKVTDALRAHLGPDVRIAGRDAVRARLAATAETLAVQGGALALDDSAAPVGFSTIVAEAGVAVVPLDSPVSKRMAVKNAVEIAQIERGHVTDGVALVKFWKWIDEEAHKGDLHENDAARKLLALRSGCEGFRETSFDSIVGWAANGADMHYNGAANALIAGDGVLLVDSGGQYAYGCTTDNTNVWAVGTPTDAMREYSTRALKGHIALATARFGRDTTGRDLDMLTRQFLRRDGRDYRHATGHDIDAYGSVHGSGGTIAPRSPKTFAPGMVMSNEPGYYENNSYGIRHERVVIVETTPDSGDDPDQALRFHTVALTPFDRNLIWRPLLDADEIVWLDSYHRRVYETLSPHLDAAERLWLESRTAPL